MAGFLDRIFGKKEVQQEKALRFDEIRSYLDSKEEDLNGRIESAAKKAWTIADAEMSKISEKVRGLEDLAEDEIKHPNPKVRHTALRSKKNFAQSMEKTLSQELPEDPDQLYAALVELIRSIANNMRRQGKYLHPAFPDEMKDIKSSLDVIGRALNTMTEDFKPSVETREKIHSSARLYDEISHSAEELRKIEVETESIGKKLETNNSSMLDLESERKALMDSGDYYEYESVKRELESLGEEKEEISGRYGSLLVSCDNVLRKTAYIAEKNGDSEVSGRMNSFALCLHSNEQRDPVEISKTYATIYPHIERIISENENLIKNKHEIQLFSSYDSFITQLNEICSAYSKTKSGILSAKGRLSSLKIDTDISRIDREVVNIDHEMEKLNQDLEAKESFRSSLEESVPLKVEDLREMLSEIEECDVIIEGDWKEIMPGNELGEA